MGTLNMKNCKMGTFNMKNCKMTTFMEVIIKKGTLGGSIEKGGNIKYEGPYLDITLFYLFLFILLRVKMDKVFI